MVTVTLPKKTQKPSSERVFPQKESAEEALASLRRSFEDLKAGRVKEFRDGKWVRLEKRA